MNNMADHKTATKAIEAARRKPRLYLPLGRGKTGKSVMSRVIAEVMPRPFDLRVIDADPNNQSLKGFCPQAEVPPAVDGDDRRVWIEGVAEEMMATADSPEKHRDVLIDLGGNDLLLKRLGGDGLAELLEASGVTPVAIHMLGTDDADLSYLREVEQAKLFCPKAVLLVLNVGIVSASRDPQLAFKPILESEIVKLVVERGGKIVIMPALDKLLMEKIEDPAVGIPSFKFAASVEGARKLGMLNSHRVKLWMEQALPKMFERIEEALA